MAKMEWTIGHDVVLRTTLGEEIAATVFAHDPASSTLLLKEPGSHNGVATLRFLSAQHVEKTLSQTQPSVPFDLTLPEVDEQRCRQREEKAMQQAQAEAAKVGVGVTKDAQAIFEAVSKTLPCSWHGKTIVVLDEVHVEEPYTARSCSSAVGKGGSRRTLERVQMIVRDARARLGLGAE